MLGALLCRRWLAWAAKAAACRKRPTTGATSWHLISASLQSQSTVRSTHLLSVSRGSGVKVEVSAAWLDLMTQARRNSQVVEPT